MVYLPIYIYQKHQRNVGKHTIYIMDLGLVASAFRPKSSPKSGVSEILVRESTYSSVRLSFQSHTIGGNPGIKIYTPPEN